VVDKDRCSERRVWIAEDLDPCESLMLSGRFSGYLEREDGSPGETFEDVSADEAIGWGRARAAIVLVRTGDGGYQSAGERNPDPSEFPAWPPSELRLGRRRPRGFEALDNTEDDPPFLWDVRLEAAVSGELDPATFHDNVRAHPLVREVRAPAPGYPATSAALFLKAATENEARAIAEEILDSAVGALLAAAPKAGSERIFTCDVEVYPHRPGARLTGPGVIF
jgi:hypothetical protein